MIAAVYIHQTKGVPYADDIVRKLKTIETRTRNTLGRFVGRRVFIVRTMAGHEPEIVGSVFVESAAYRTAEWLDAHRNETLIPPGSKFDCHGAGKWCYRLSDALQYGPFPLRYFPVVNKTRTYAMIETQKEATV